MFTGQKIYSLGLVPETASAWRWLQPMGIYGGSILLSFGLFGVYRRNLEKRYQKERRMNQLQLLSLNKQVDPHFVLNALDNVDWMYRHQEWKEASSAMSRLSRLMQKSVLHAGQITVSLYEELDFCRNYCALEENRTPDFSCSMAVGDGLDPKDIQVPRQLIFTHVENAIKHGIRPKEKGEKRLEVKLWREGPELHISITDTGIGRNTPKNTQGTGKGLKLLREIIPLYRKTKGVDIQLQINDLTGGGLQVKMVLHGVLENPRG